ncbi:MAG TPA: chorismate synthase [Candidatus Dormibacteraeota bacterium]|nr:chorismate synthase [Candidatus Dormibacteraeota bacterium]
MTLRLLTAGESHGPELILVLDGMPAGVRVNGEEIDHQLRRRQGGYGRGARSTKVERDHGEIVAGVAEGKTTGAPVAIRIRNLDYANQPESRPALTTPRPGHADLAGAIKYGLSDLRQVRERASARETAARVAAGSLVRPLLDQFGIVVGSFVTSIGAVAAELDLARMDRDDLLAAASAAERDSMRCADQAVSARMVRAVDEARVARETLGGTFVVFAVGLPVGLGSHTQWDRRLDTVIAGSFCSIPAVKGVEIGPAFEVSAMVGTKAQDAIVSKGERLARETNFAGGLEGGMTDGQPLVVRAAMKPLSSVRAPLPSVDLGTGSPSDPPYIRSDVCAVPAAAVVGEAALSLVLAGAIVERFGGDRLDAMLASARVASGLPLEVSTL